jgi:hypothetical protein
VDKFEETWNKVAIPRNDVAVSPELHLLLKHFYVEMAKNPPNLQEIKSSLEELLSFLNSIPGCTSANCFATDLFINYLDWHLDWDAFPEELTNIIGDMGGALHDAVDSPEIAKNFNGLPEQLLERIQRWKTN